MNMEMLKQVMRERKIKQGLKQCKHCLRWFKGIGLHEQQCDVILIRRGQRAERIKHGRRELLKNNQ